MRILEYSRPLIRFWLSLGVVGGCLGISLEAVGAPPPKPAATANSTPTGKGATANTSTASPPTTPKTSSTPVGSEAKRETAKPTSEVLLTRDKLSVHFTYWRVDANPNAPVVVLLHGKTGNRLDWPAPFLEQLHREGYALIAVDLRGHGQSKGGDLAKSTKASPALRRLEAGKLKTEDYQAMVTQDLEGVKQFIYEEHQKKFLNMNKMGIIAAEVSANLALVFTEFDWKKRPHEDHRVETYKTPRGKDVRALVLISPDPPLSGFKVGEAVKFLRDPKLGVALFFCFGVSDKQDQETTTKLFQSANPGDAYKTRMYLKEFQSPLRGTELLGRNLQLEEMISVFLDRHLRQVNSTWRDRESKLKSVDKK